MNAAAVLDEVLQERTDQDAKWGKQDHADGTGGEGRERIASAARQSCELKFERNRGTWADIFEEEAAEALAESDPALLREELIQVAAVAVAWVEAIDRRSTT